MNYRCVLCSADLRNPVGSAPPCRACDSCADLYHRIQRGKLDPREEVACEKINRQCFSRETNKLETFAEYQLTK